MQVSDKGQAALMVHEGIVPGPYLDAANPPVWTVYVGHTAAAGDPIPAKMPRGMPIDLDAALNEALRVFKRDLQRYAAEVEAALRVPVHQHEFDALVSFHYNTGAIARASLTASLNAGNRTLAASQFMNWLTPSSIRGRREAERDLFAKGIYPSGAIPVWRVNQAGKIIWTPIRTLSQSAAVEMLKTLGPDTGQSEKDRATALQTELKALGLYTMKIDGIWGKGSQAALDAFHAAAGRINALLET